MDDRLPDYPVVITQAVAWGEMDAFRHVNNTVYFRYFENVRLAYFMQVGFDHPDRNGGVGPILASTNCRFRIPLTFPDTVHVGARVSEIAEERFVMQYAVYSEAHQKIAAEGEGLIVCLDYRCHAKVPIPAQVRQEMERLAGRG